MINTMKIAILGFGREGKSNLKFLKKSPQFKKATISILDRKFDKPPHQTRIGAFGAKKEKSLLWCGGKNYLKNLNKFDIVFRSPGVPYNLPQIQKAIKSGVKLSSSTQLFFDEARRIGCKIIGITGTKGKGTTATLLYKILKACGPAQRDDSHAKRGGKNIFLAGNIGKSAIDLLPKLKKNSIVILELSSFQLQDLKKSPDISVVLDIFPDHLDAHKNLQEYFNAKTNIVRWQKKTDKIFYFSDNRWSKWVASKSRAKKIPIRIYSDHSDALVISDRDLKMPGEHNFKNAVMAATVALSLGCQKEKIIKIIKNFKGNEHRLELVKIIRIYSGHSDEFVNSGRFIKFYNDSASTNPQTAAAAIKSFKEPKILIAGGKDKGLNYSPLAKALKNSNTKLVILFGENKRKIQRQITNSKAQIVLVKDLKSAVNLAYKTAKQLILQLPNSPITIIFSPASASFDMFKDYADRGKKFKELVRSLK